MDDFLSLSIFLLILGGLVFSWLDWHLRARKLPVSVGPSWTCPNCAVVNEADLGICWSCGAGIAGRILLPDRSAVAESWQCRTCHAWNGMSRRTCWSCARAVSTARKKRSA